MKKINYLLILIILLIPIFVQAEDCNPNEVIIKAITIKGQSSTAEEITSATIDKHTINMNLKFQEVGDYVLYTAFIENDSKEDYQFQTDSIAASSDYIEYKVVSEDTIIKPNETKIIEIKATYKKEVEDEKFENGTFTDNKQLVLNLSFDENLVNPETGPSHTIFSVLCILLGITIIVKTIKDDKKLKKASVLIIISSIMIPLTASALCLCKIEINSNVVIEKESKKICVITGFGSCNDRLHGENIQKRLLNREEFSTFLENIGSPDNPTPLYEFIDIENIEKESNNDLIYQISKDQILDYSKGCYVFSEAGSC